PPPPHLNDQSVHIGPLGIGDQLVHLLGGFDPVMEGINPEGAKFPLVRRFPRFRRKGRQDQQRHQHHPRHPFFHSASSRSFLENSANLVPMRSSRSLKDPSEKPFNRIA